MSRMSDEPDYDELDDLNPSELVEEAAWQRALSDHPDWKTQWEKGELPEEIIGANGEPMSPTFHITLHAIVEGQLESGTPDGVVLIAEKLAELGLDRHDVVHAIGEAMCNQIWEVTKNGRAFSEVEYLADLRAIVDSRR
jgi:hypothetical protein